MICRNGRPGGGWDTRFVPSTTGERRSHKLKAAIAAAGTALAAFTVALALAAPAYVPDAARGRSLYELRCGECHSESVHGRPHRVARDIDEVRVWVRRWSDHLHLGWRDEEVADVAAYLDATYYKFDCESPACRALSLVAWPKRR
ncbi:MAG TPA: hypothetical protein VLS49_08570 [Usitatibacter sp.]|nr:hypothetical protein [Usitatibacter sp.]